MAKKNPNSKSATNVAQPGAGIERPTNGPPATRVRLGRRAFREVFESLSLANQFRVAAVAAVTVALLAVQMVVAAWDTWSVRRDTLASAREVAASIATHIEKSGTTGALDSLATHRGILAADLKMDDGRVLERYERDAEQDGTASGDLPAVTPASDSLAHRAARFLALEPMHVRQSVEFRPEVGGTLSLLVDNGPVWDTALGRVGQSPVVLLLGVLVALLAANSLRRQVVEPLAQLADATRVRTGLPPAPTPQGAGRRNELTELAINFDNLADRLAEYEKDLLNLRVTSRQEIIERTRELETGLRHAEALTRSKDEFLANMSHEIRTPMNGVLGMAELLAGTDLDKRQRRYVDSMRTAAESMMQIINDILDDSKIEAGKMDLVRETFEVREFAEQVAQLWAGRAESKKLELICRVEPTVPAAVEGDVLRLRQVVGNLMSNAVKYTQQGEVQIRIGLDALDGEHCRLHFTVSDTGPGIPEAEQATVFEAFTQLGNGQRVGGTGLGLSIATRLVKLMGGEKIDLRSQVGHGSSFSFVLPFTVREAAPAPNRTSDEFAGLRVLVVDDSSTSYMHLEETLSNWSADVTVLNHGRLLGDKLRDAATRGRPYAVVLLDHSLPDATTADLLRTIRLDPAVAGTYVVLMSAFDFDPTFEGSKAIKPDVCIAKPVGQTLLRSALQESRQPREPETTAVAARLTVREAEDPSGLPALGLDVLVADDNAINREVALAMLERVGCRVTLVEDGGAAVNQAHTRRFDAILMDCQMPGMDGYTATAAIRREETDRGRAPTCIVALTANVLARDRSRALEAGMNHFLGKPFTNAQLLAILKPIAESRGTLVAPPPPAAATEDDMLQIPADFAAPPPAPAPVTRAPVEVDDEPILSDTVVLDMLEVPVVDSDPVNEFPTLDPAQISAIRSLGKPQVFERLCELLYTTAPETLGKLSAALEQGDLEAFAAAAHSLKSPVGNLGGRRLAAQLERCEAAAREQCDLKAARKAARGLKQTYSELEEALRAETRRATGT